MGLTFWKKTKFYRPEILLQQLEERIVLDASIAPVDQDNQHQDQASHQDHVATPTPDGAPHDNLQPQAPPALEHVFNEGVNVVLISGDLADAKAISDAAHDHAEVIVYDSHSDNLATLTAKLQTIVDTTGHKIDNLAIVGHGTEGALTIGSDQIQFFGLGNFKATFELLGQNLSNDAQIQFYGCSVAGDVLGKAMVDRIAIYTQAETFASTDITGGVRHDWNLEFSSDPSISMHNLLNTDSLAAVQSELVAVTPWVQIQTGSAGGWSGNADNPLFTNVNGTLFFKAGNNGSDYELYTSDGTIGGTDRVLDINTGSASSNPYDLISFGGKLFFTADDGTHGRELWVSDGTNLGTHLFSDINNAATGSFAEYGANNFTVFNGKLYFTASDGVNGSELWVTDGVDNTAAHTHIVKDLTPGPAGSTISNLTVVNDSLFFAGTTTAKNLWMTDGISDPFQVSTVANSISSMVNFNGTLFFSATGNGLGQELWTSDGTSAGTFMFADVYTGSSSSTPVNFTVVNDYLFFTATKIPGGLQLWGTDGNSAPTAINTPGATSYSGIKFLTESGGKLFFGEATTGTTANTNTPQLWMYDPTNGLSGSAVNITGVAGSGLQGTMNIGLWSISDANGTPYFSYSSNTFGWEVFDYNSSSGTITAHEVDTGATSSTNAMFPVFVNGSVFWTGYTSTYGRDLYRYQISPWETAADAPLNTVQSLGTFSEDATGALALDSPTVGDPNGDNLTVKLTATAGFSDISLDGINFHKVLNLSGDATTINASLANLTGHLKSNFFGSAEIDIKTTDPSGWSDTDRLFATVTPVDDPPTLTLPTSTTSFTEDQYVTTAVALASGTSIFQVFDADPGDILTLTVTAGAGFSGVNLTNAAGVFATSDSITGTWDYINSQIANKVFVKQATDFNGTAELNFTVSDSSSPTPLTASGMYTKTVTAVNDVPVYNGLPTSVVSTNEDTPVVLTGVTISDVDLGYGPETSPYTVTLTTLKSGIGTGTVHVFANAAVTGNDTETVTLSGTLAEVDQALAGLTFVPYAENYIYAGSTPNANLIITASDNGNIGTGAVIPQTTTVDFLVSPVPDTPVNTLTPVTVPSGADPTISLAGAISVHDGDVNDTLFVDVKAGPGVLGIGYGAGAAVSPEFVFVGTESYLNTLLNGLKVQVAGGFSGPAEVTVTTTDASGLSDVDVLTLTFNGPTASPPQITTSVAGLTVAEDQPVVDLGTVVLVNDPNGDPVSVDLTFGPGSGWADLAVTNAGAAAVTTGANSLNVSGALADVQGALASLVGHLTLDFNGTATFSVSATDSTSAPVTATVDIPVSAVNDAPVNTVPVSVTVDEDALTAISGISISDVDAGAGQVQVTLSVTNGAIHVASGVAGGLQLAGITGNDSGTVTLNGTMDEINATMADAAGIQYQSTLNYNGSDTLTITTSDLGATGSPGPLTDTDSIAVTVSPVNDAPVNTVPLSAAATSNLPTTISGISITDVDAGTSDIQVTLTVAQGTLHVSDAVGGGLGAAAISGNDSVSVVLTGALAQINATLADANGAQYLSALDYTGPDTLTVATDDLGATGSGGAKTDSDPIAITVEAGVVNVAPVIDIGAVVPQTDPTGAVIFDAAHNDLISITDADAGTGQLKVTLAATHGTLSLSGITGLAFDPGQGDGTADATMTFSGTITDINNALNGMTFTHDAGYYGMADVTVTANDQGNTGSGGAQISTNTASVSVEPYDVWFAGFGSEAGWQVYNYATEGSRYTQDYVTYWHIDQSNNWWIYDGSNWYATTALQGEPADVWFHGFGADAGWDVYNYTATNEGTRYTQDYVTYWHEDPSNNWWIYDGSNWYATTALQGEPADVWFHGFGADAGWDVYNYTATNEGTRYTQNYVTYWHEDLSNSWWYYNGSVWGPTTGRGITA